MLNKCDVYLPSTCFTGMAAYKTFNELPNKRGYGIKIISSEYNKEIKDLLFSTN